ncbi:MAG: TolC family protein [Planctomycetaceae bacterium]|nr:TolC family protein [Planctomycetaceae bacterium]
MIFGLPVDILNTRQLSKIYGVLLLAFIAGSLVGCQHRAKQVVDFSGDCSPCQSLLQQIEYPELEDEEGTDGLQYLSGPPVTISNFQDLTPLEMTVEQCVEMALANSKVMQKLGGLVVNSPQAATTLYDQAINETGLGSVEAALSAFDAQVDSSLLYSRRERFINQAFLGGAVTNASNFNFGIGKQTASGASYGIRNLTDYNRNANPFAIFNSNYNMVTQLEFRQPLGRGRGSAVNRIAGPNATPGNYNGVLIARIRSDVSLADFEVAVRNLVRNVEDTYWELYFSYRDLDTKIGARDSAQEAWDNRKKRLDEGVGRPDDEALARQQYFNFQVQAQDILTGQLNGVKGVLGSDRDLRRLMNLPASDGTIILPTSDPALAPVAFDWEQSQVDALNRRVEIRRQKWVVRQRELELLAAKALNKWRFDLTGQYGARGFGRNLFGTQGSPNGGAFNDMFKGNLDDWQLGFEFGGAIGNRIGHLSIRNAELKLARERTLLNEQQRQILLDLNQAFTEVDRSIASLRTNFDARIAAEEEINPKQKRFDEGQDQIFFLLDAQQRKANTESRVHRSVAEYNKALLNYVYTTGTLLSRYNIFLTEGEWSENARANAVEKAPRFEKGPLNFNSRDVSPLSFGAYDQRAVPLSVSAAAEGEAMVAPAVPEPAGQK